MTRRAKLSARSGRTMLHIHWYPRRTRSGHWLPRMAGDEDLPDKMLVTLTCRCGKMKAKVWTDPGDAAKMIEGTKP